MSNFGFPAHVPKKPWKGSVGPQSIRCGRQPGPADAALECPNGDSEQSDDNAETPDAYSSKADLDSSLADGNREPADGRQSQHYSASRAR